MRHCLGVILPAWRVVSNLSSDSVLVRVRIRQNERSLKAQQSDNFYGFIVYKICPYHSTYFRICYNYVHKMRKSICPSFKNWFIEVASFTSSNPRIYSNIQSIYTSKYSRYMLSSHINKSIQGILFCIMDLMFH